MKNRIPILVVVASLLLAFIAFEVHSIVSALQTNASSGSGGANGVPGPGEFKQKPTIPYPELCIGIVMLDKTNLKLSESDKAKILPQLEELQRISDKMHEAEAKLADSMSPQQREWIETHKADLRKGSVAAGKPPVEYAMLYLHGGKIDDRSNGEGGVTKPPDDSVPPPGGKKGGDSGMTPQPPPSEVKPTKESGPKGSEGPKGSAPSSEGPRGSAPSSEGPKGSAPSSEGPRGSAPSSEGPQASPAASGH